MLLTARDTNLAPQVFVAQHGEIFSVFDAATQDSGNVSYGVRTGDGRLFVKTAGLPDALGPLLSHAERVALLRNAVLVAQALNHPAVPALRNVIESPEGPLLVYDWVEGELLGATAARRAEPDSAFARFQLLPASERIAALDVVLQLHTELAAREWIASDFYDGCLIYDFVRHATHVVDLDTYHSGPFTNRMGRMFGSTRFMAPEELELGAPIDERTTVFTMGRTIQQFLSADDPGAPELLDLAAQACRSDPSHRIPSMAALYQMWGAARGS